MGAQAQGLFAALAALGRNFVVIAPNNDPGSAAIFAEIDTLPKDRFRVLPSMRFAHFSELMKNAAVMVGNSSAGVREAPFSGAGLAGYRHTPDQPREIAVGVLCQCGRYGGD